MLLKSQLSRLEIQSLKIKDRIFEILKLRKTKFGIFLFLVYGCLSIVLLYCIFGVILEPFGILYQYLMAVYACITFIFGYIFFRLKTTLYTFLENLPLFSHLLIMLGISLIYCGSYLWNKKQEIQTQK
jgi:hypothetical protein